MGAISLTGKGIATVSMQPGDPYAQKNEFAVTLKNVGLANATLDRLDLIATNAGGWVWSISDLTQQGLEDNDTPSHILDSGALFKPGQERTFVFPWNSGVALTHGIFRIASNGSAEEFVQIPLVRDGYAVPSPLPAASAVFVGFWISPMEIVDVWRNGSVVRWLTVAGMLFNGTYAPLSAKSVAIKVVVDGTTLIATSMPPQFLDWYGIPQSGPAKQNPDGSYALATPVSPFAYGFDLSKCPDTFKKAELTVAVTYSAGGPDQTAAATVPLKRMAAVSSLRPPLRGWWRWGNSADHLGFDGHAWPHQRLAVDYTMWKDGSSHAAVADPKNEDFYAYGQPVYAACPGTVVSADDTSDENDGYKQLNTGTNYVLVQHADGFTGYFHLRKGANKVKAGDYVVAGQQLGEVGNSGGSSEPHLHFGYVTADDLGRPQLRPMAFVNVRDTEGTKVPVTPGNGEYKSGLPKKKPKKKYAPKDKKKIPASKRR